MQTVIPEIKARWKGRYSSKNMAKDRVAKGNGLERRRFGRIRRKVAIQLMFIYSKSLIGFLTMHRLLEK